MRKSYLTRSHTHFQNNKTHIKALNLNNNNKNKRNKDKKKKYFFRKFAISICWLLLFTQPPVIE